MVSTLLTIAVAVLTVSAIPAAAIIAWEFHERRRVMRMVANFYARAGAVETVVHSSDHPNELRDRHRSDCRVVTP